MSGCSRSVGRHAAWLAVAVLALAGLRARAAEIETRDFVVFVGGKAAGEAHMTIHRQDDGTVTMRCDTDINVHKLIGKYKFIYRGVEVWKDRRLVRFDSQTDDNGTRYIVHALAEADGLKLRVNNVERKARADVWLTSYWSLPDPKLRAAPLALLDADNGRDLDAKLAYVATEKRTVAGQEVPLNHYRLTGKVQVDLWYDGAERLVRQEWMEQGHKTVMELTRVRR
jgi:hypothetical protein